MTARPRTRTVDSRHGPSSAWTNPRQRVMQPKSTHLCQCGHTRDQHRWGSRSCRHVTTFESLVSGKPTICGDFCDCVRFDLAADQ